MSVSGVWAQIHALDYETPAYIDFTLSEISVSEREKAVVLNISRTGDFRQWTRITFATEEISASEGQDYQGTGGTLVFQPGEGMKQITIGILADTQAENDETFRIIIKDAGSNTVLMRAAALITITDAPALLSGPMIEVAAGGPGKISLSWLGSPDYIVERASNPAEGGWQEFPCTPTVKADRCQVVVDAGEQRYLYRLRDGTPVSDGLGD